MATPHGTSTCSLPLHILNLKCSCSNRYDAKRVCLGCYQHYCVPCYQEHRRQISVQLGHIIHESDVILQAMLPTLKNNENQYVFNPIQLRKEIIDRQEKFIHEIKQTTQKVLESLKRHMDERSDFLLDKIDPITASHLNSWKAFKNYIETHLERFKEEIKTENNKMEKESTTTVLVNIDYAHNIDWRRLIELQTVSQKDFKRQQSINVLKEPNFKYLTKGHKPFKSIQNQGNGNAIAASSQLVLFARGDNELCIVETRADYRTIIPLSHDKDSVTHSVKIVDLCWSSATNEFIILTNTQLASLCPYRKIPTTKSKIQPPNGRTFGSCTCSDDKLLLSYEGKGSPIEEWNITNLEKKCSWNPPVSCNKDKSIHCIRLTRNGTFIGVALDENRKEARFEVRNTDTMSCVWRRDIPALPCIGIIPFTDTIWLVGVFNYNKLFLLDRNKDHVEEIVMTDPGESSLRGITLVEKGTVVSRTASTVIFFDLLVKSSS